MIPYILLYLSILFVSIFSNSFKKKSEGRVVLFFMTCLIIIVFQSIRDFSVGADVSNYLSKFHEMRVTPWETVIKGEKYYETGYLIFNKLLTYFVFSDRAFLIVISIICIAPIFYIMYKEKELDYLAIITYMSFFSFTLTFSAFRQCIAMSLCFVAFYYIRKKKFITQLLLVLLAATFHKSAIVFLCTYPAYYLFGVKKKNILLIAAVFVMIFVFRIQIVTFVITKFFPRYLEYGIYDTGFVNFLILLVLILAFSLVFGGNTKESNRIRSILLVAIFIQIFATVNILATRFTAYYVMLLPFVIQEAFNNQENISLNLNHDKPLLSFGTLNDVRILKFVFILVLIMYAISNIVTVNDVKIYPFEFCWR